eukprot:scaffold144634_cov53-Attheya_sp.AAC.1
MAIAINPHTYSGILFDSPAMVLAWFVILRSRADSFLCSALVSFGGKKDVIGFVFCCREMICSRTIVIRVSSNIADNHSKLTISHRGPFLRGPGGYV